MTKISKTKHITKKGVVKKNPSKRKPLKSYKEKRPKLIEMIGKEAVVTLENHVDRIENSIPTTRNHYGDYMALLSSFPTEQRKTISYLIVYMGANEQGVIDALKNI